MAKLFSFARDWWMWATSPKSLRRTWCKGFSHLSMCLPRQTYLPWVHGGRLPRNVDFVLQSSKHRLLHCSQNYLILMGVYMIWRASHWSGRTALGVSLPRPAARYGRWVVELFSWIIIPLHPDICLGLSRELVIFGQMVVISHEQMWVWPPKVGKWIIHHGGFRQKPFPVSGLSFLIYIHMHWQRWRMLCIVFINHTTVLQFTIAPIAP